MSCFFLKNGDFSVQPVIFSLFDAFIDFFTNNDKWQSTNVQKK